jgi:hypothetical protein
VLAGIGHRRLARTVQGHVRGIVVQASAAPRNVGVVNDA